MARHAARGIDVAIAVGALALAFASIASAQSPRHQTVLTVHWGSEDDPTNPVLDAGIRDALLSRPGAAVDYYAEYLESESFPPEDASLALRDYIHRKYGGRRIDVVVASADPALEFVLRFRPELFPDAAVVYRGVAPVDPALREAGAGLTGIRTSENLADTLRLALRLQPATERVLVVAQAPGIRLQESLRAAGDVAAHSVAIDVLTDAPLPRLIAAIEAAPSRSLILYLRYSQQTPNVLIPSDVARMVAAASPVPVYGASDLYIGSGVIGGAVYRTRGLGTRMGQMANQILDGARPQDIPIEEEAVEAVFDWRQLQRWGISESQLPAGSEILFRQPGVWELYRAYILSGALVVIVQSALIAVLMLQRVRRRRMETALRESEQRFRGTAEQNQDLAGRLIHAQEEERTRIARDLHDDLSQQLAGVGIMLSGLRRRIGKLGAEPGIEQAVAAIQDRTASLARSVRNLSHELHPSVLQHAGLVATLRSHCASVEDHHRVTVKFSGDGHLDSLSPEVSLCLFRVVQEALTNAARHARARTIRVQLMSNNEDVELTVIDDGIGFDAGERSTGSGLGLRSIEERVRLARGTVTVESRPGQGTTLRVRIPIAAAQAELT